MGTSYYNAAGGGGGGGAVTLRWTGISLPGRSSWQYSNSLHATETGVKRWPDGPLARRQTFSLPVYMSYRPLFQVT